MKQWICFLWIIGAVFSQAWPAADEAFIRVENFKNGETIRYPVALIRGTLGDPQADAIAAINEASRRPNREIAGAARNGRFVVLSELVPGENQLAVRSGSHQTSLTLNYKPQTNPYFVRVIYLLDNSGRTDYPSPLSDDPQNYRDKIDTAMKLMQTFAAESMRDLGHGRYTFNLELDADGKVIVHTPKQDKPREDYFPLTGLEWWRKVYAFLSPRYPMQKAKNVAIASYTTWDPKNKKALAHTALGGGGLGLFGSGGLYTWPNSLNDVVRAFSDARVVDASKAFDDSAFRQTYWANASTGIGATLHELTHAFGLPHDPDPLGIMSRGFDQFNRMFTLVEPPHKNSREPFEFKPDQIARWSPAAAAALRWNRYFALDDIPRIESDPPRIQRAQDGGAAIIEAPHGLRFAAVFANDGWQDYRAFPETTSAPARLRFPIAEWTEYLGADTYELCAIDGQENWSRCKSQDLKDAAPAGTAKQPTDKTSDTKIPDMKNATPDTVLWRPKIPVRAWRFASVTKPWTDHKRFASLSENDLKEIAASAAQAPLMHTSGTLVNFAARFPPNKHENIAGYALRAIQSPRVWKIRLYTGSDDALRVWLNGSLVQEALTSRSAAPDSECAEITLTTGENQLLAEVSQIRGGWFLCLRLEDLDGAPLRLTDEGRLERME
ncbi:MAG: hypothetical protein NTX50_25260 [Candidatus Sumerlaeota bacterium]|nr:hypothetical protein [Candidatus Sumerlaeota bacterium]